VERLMQNDGPAGLRPDPRALETAAAAPARSVFRHFLVNIVALILAAVALVAYQHYKLHGQSQAALISLVAAGLLALTPLRALLGAFFSLERHVLHAFHGLGTLAFAGLAAGGAFSGGSMLNHAAMAPFAIMGAAQAIMHQDHPRNPQQAAALRAFATSLPEVAEFTKGSLTSPENAKRAVVVLQDLIGKAQALGETELQADRNFQSALAHATARTGVTLGLDSIEQVLNRLAANPAAASAVPDLRRQLARARALAKADTR
jgi:hypothetical protein